MEPDVGVPMRPKWLPSIGPGNLNVDPEKWAMTLSQWAAFIVACMISSEERWNELSKSTERKENGYVNLYQICDHFVKPWTRNLGNSIALLLNNGNPLQAQLMVSHAWAENVLDSLSAVLSKVTAIGMNMDTAIWFCTFAQYQPGDMDGDCGPSVAAQIALEPFKRVIESRPPYGMLVIHTAAAELYGRLWCVFEVNEAIATSLVVFAAPSMGYFLKCHGLQLSGTSLQAICDCKSKKAECWSSDDAKMIRKKIETGIGYDALDSQIIKFREDALTRMVDAYDPMLVWAEPAQKALNMDRFTVLQFLGFSVIAAAVFHGFQWLAKFADGHEDKWYMEAIMKSIRSHNSLTLELMKCTDGVGNDLGPPPGFDPAKKKPDTFLEQMKTDDDLLKHCLQNMDDFMQPLAWLEAAAGVSSDSQIACLESFDTTQPRATAPA